MAIVEICVPDIGDFTDVAIIEMLVHVDDTVAVDQSLVTVESDKASMEIPSSHAGVVRQLLVKLGDKVSKGSKLALMEVAGITAATTEAPTTTTLAANPIHVAEQPAPVMTSPIMAAAAMAFSVPKIAVDVECDVLVLGGGPGGYSAAFRAADLGMKVVLVERYGTLGGVCLNVGCIPSKALLHMAGVIDESKELKHSGLFLNEPMIDLAKLREHKTRVVSKLTTGLAQMAKMRKVTHIRGIGQFLDAHHMNVEETTGAGQEKTGAGKVIRFKYAIIAVGSAAVHLPFLPNDPRIVDSTGALALKEVPKRMLILGGGIIGLEMGTVYSSLGTRLDVVEMTDGLMQGADRDLVKVWQKKNAPRFDRIMLNTKTIAAQVNSEGVEITFSSTREGEKAPESQVYDLVLQSVGRMPNGNQISASNAGVKVTDRGFIPVDIQLRTNVRHIFAIGDVVGQPMLAHKAVHEAHIAAEVIAGELLSDPVLASAAFTARVIPSVAYTHPEVAWVGLTEDAAKTQGIKVKKAIFPWAASGRAIANGCEEGFTKLLFEEGDHGKVLGGSIVGANAGDIIGEVALAIEMGADSVDIGATIHPHPTLGETIGMAAEVLHGSCTDVPPARK